MDNTTVLRFGTFGPRGAGKTVSLAALFHRREGDGIELEVLHVPTIEYLRPLSDGLGRGQFPPATVPKTPDQLEWIGYIDDQQYTLQCIDFAGELTDPIWKAGPEQFRHEVGKWFGECNAILLFIDCTSTDRLYQDAIDRLLSELERQETWHGSRLRAVAVVITKADRLPGAAPHHIKDPAKVEHLLAGHEIYRRLKKQLARKSNTVLYQVFLSSAVGWEFENAGKGRVRVEPCNLFEALRWAVVEAGRIVARTHEEKLTRAEEMFEAWCLKQRVGLPNYARMIKELDALTERSHMHDGPLAVRVRNKRRELLRKMQNQRIALGVFAASLLLTSLTIVWFLVRRGEAAVYDNFAALVKEQPGDDKVRDRLKYHDRHIKPRKRDWFWGLTAQRKQADERAAKDRVVLARILAEEAFHELVKQDRQLAGANQGPQRHARALEYLARHGEAAAEERLKHIGRIIGETHEAYDNDRKAWKQASETPLDKPGDYETKVQQVRAYAGRPDALSKEEARALIVALGRQEQSDRTAFAQLVEISKTANHSTRILELEKLAGEYLATSEHGKTRRDEVEAHLKELARFKQARQVQITVKSVRIPEAFLNRTWTGNPKTSVTVKVDAASFTTRQVGTSNLGEFVADVNQNLGPFPVVWGQKQVFEVKMEVHRTVFSNETAAATFKDEVYILNHANGTVQLKSGPFSSTMVSVELECTDAAAPALRDSTKE